MKKLPTLLAAGVLALGVAAQADIVESAEYAVITIPVTEGYNYVGISVAPTSEEQTIASLLGLAGNTSVYKWTGMQWSGDVAAQTSASVGDGLYFKADANDTIYELGKATYASTDGVAAKAKVTVAAGALSLVATPYSAGCKLSVLKLTDAAGVDFVGATRPTKAVKIYKSNDATSYYWYSKTGWKANDGKAADDEVIGAAQAVFVSAPSASAVTVEFPAPAEPAAN